MKPLVAIVCMMFAVFAFGAETKQAPKKTSLTEAELRTIAKASPNVKDAGTLYSVGMATNNVERQQEYLQASAACLLAFGKWDIYRKHIRGKLANAAAFEERLKDKCKQCAGTGKKDRRCYVCSGKGRCSTCKGSGKTVSVGFERANGTKPCHKCKGSGRCQKCGGGGSTKEKCATCGGAGKVFSETFAVRVFRETCNAIADAKSGRVDSVKTAKSQVKAKEIQQRSVVPNEEEVRRKAKEEFAKQCNTSGGAAEVAYWGTNFSIVEKVVGGDNFVITDYLYAKSTGLSFAVLPSNSSRSKWYEAVEVCAVKIKEWVRVAKRNKVEHVEKEIPIVGINVKAYSDRVTSGRGQLELFNKTIRADYSQRIPENVKFIGSVKAAYANSFERFDVSIRMICGEYFNHEIFSMHGTVEEIDKKLIEFLIFANPESLGEARKKQAEKEELFR